MANISKCLGAALALMGCIGLPLEQAAAETAQPYTGEQRRAVKSLSESQIAQLKAGAGMGYAKSAELNGWPGPLHVLELAEELDLTEVVRGQVEAIFATMQVQAQVLGEDLIAAEAAIDALFAEPEVRVDAIRAATAQAADIEARLRAVHLIAHVETTPLLTPHQRMIYSKARGYEPGQSHQDHSGHDHTGHDH